MPRSILKRSSDCDAAPSYSPEYALFPYQPPAPTVHFPPSPSLSKTYPTYGVNAYDRAPIVVAPNVCALPERGCPGRTYDESAGVAKSSRKCKVQPHCLGAAATSPSSASMMSAGQAECSAAAAARMYGPMQPSYPGPSSRPPPLVQDLSSESDESDGAISPPEYGNPIIGVLPPAMSYPYSPYAAAPSQEQLDKALSFLPHPPPSRSEREKQSKRRCSSGGKLRSISPTRYKSEDGTRSFAASSLDGCLGGF